MLIIRKLTEIRLLKRDRGWDFLSRDQSVNDHLVIYFFLLKSQGHVKERLLFSVHVANVRRFSGMRLTSKKIKYRQKRQIKPSKSLSHCPSVCPLAKREGQVFYQTAFPKRVVVGAY